jgi:hypothetical protein
MNEANTYVRPDNGRIECRACRTRVVREQRRKRLEKLPETDRKFFGGYPPEMACRTCKEVKPLEEFTPRERSGNKIIYRNRSCKTCRSKINRNFGLRKRYGITAEEYDSLLADQGGTCALCDREPIGNEVFSVDHEHSTNRVRGIVCQPCNVAIGFFETRIDVERMRQYLSA